MGVTQVAKDDVGLGSSACGENRVLEQGSRLSGSACADGGTHVQPHDVLFAGAHTARDIFGRQRQAVLVVGGV